MMIMEFKQIDEVRISNCLSRSITDTVIKKLLRAKISFKIKDYNLHKLYEELRGR